MTRVLLVRHGETEWNAIGRIQGHTDIGLSERGRRQAQAIAARLARAPIHAVYSSDLSRALDTAGPIATEHGLSVVPITDLREKSYGDWEGMTGEEIKAASPEGWRRYHVLRQIDYAVPGGETWAQVQARLLAVLRRVLADHPGVEESVLLVGHGGSLRALILDALQAPLPTLLRLRLDNASLSVLEYHPERGGRVVSLNETGHVEGVTL